MTDLAARAVVGRIHEKPVPREALDRGVEAYTIDGTHLPGDADPVTGWVGESSGSLLQT